MTDVEYNEFAQKILNDSNFEIEFSSLNITNIGEVFLLKIKEGLAMLDEHTFPCKGADKVKNRLLPFFNDLTNDESEDVGELPLSDKVCLFISYILFGGIRLAIKNHPDPEFMLQNMGVENAMDFINRVNDVENINNVDELYESINDIGSSLASIIGPDKLINISVWGMISLFGKKVIRICKQGSTEEVLAFFKYIKYLGEKYPLIYKERIASIYYNIKTFFNDANIGELIPQTIFDDFFNNSIYLKSFTDIYAFMDEKFGDEHTYLGLDLMFSIYYLIYDKPQYLVKLGFALMLDKMPGNVSKALFLTFREQDYAALIQYEYVWWCKETGGELSLPFPFFEGAIDLQNIDIVDYNLDYKIPLKIEQTIDDNMSIENRNNYSIQILHDLEPYFVVFDKGVSSEKGSVYKRDYSSLVITFSEKISSSWPVYGLAYILYKSRYFNWGDGCKFDEIFVRKIAGIFNLQDKLTTSYPENKAKNKAWEILQENKNLQGLLDSDKMKELEPVKKKS